VLGGISEAESGSLAIFVGGPDAIVARHDAAHLWAWHDDRRRLARQRSALAILGEALAIARGLGLATDAAYQVLARTPLAAQAERRRHAIEARRVASRLEIARETLSDCIRVAVVGDNLASDIAGGKPADLEAILVLTDSSDEDDLARVLRPLRGPGRSMVSTAWAVANARYSRAEARAPHGPPCGHP
jgi:HAD-hyrolase-like